MDRNDCGDWVRSITRRMIKPFVCFLLSLTAANIASAQEVEPNEFVPLPDGTNLAFGYYLYGHDTDFSFARGPTVKGSGVEINLFNARYVHFDYIAGLPAGFQIFQVFGSESAAHVDGQSLGSAFGASNTALSAFFWPYSSVARKQYLNVTGFVYPPTGTYDKNSPINVASALGGTGWVGDVQAGWDHGIGDHFSYDLAFDARFYGDVTRPGGLRVSQSNDYRLQAWANWNWTRAFQTAIGWESILGGTQRTNGFNNGTKSEFERLRFSNSLFVAANAQILVELNHDFVTVGGFKQPFGLTTRFVYAF